MANTESEIERRAGLDMVPLGESFEWNPGPDDGAPVLRSTFHVELSEPLAVSGRDIRKVWHG